MNYSVSAQGFCGANVVISTGTPTGGGNPPPDPDPSPIPTELFDYLNQTTDIEGEKEICLNVFFHTVRDDDGKESDSTHIKLNGTVDDIIDQLNNDYAPYKISFKKIGEDFIDDSRYVNMLTHLRYPSLFKKNVYDNAINIYLVDRAPDRGTGRIPSNTFFIVKSAAISAVSSHEMGHCFGLYHTHEAKEFDSEEINNCKGTGDLMCDTPPDSGMLKETRGPNGELLYHVDSNCEYTKGDAYTPDTNNFMSYTNPDCMNRFSNEQITQVKYNILNLPVLQATLSCDCSAFYLIGKPTICVNETAVYTFPCLTGVTQENINISAGLELDAFDATSVTVTPVQTSSYKGGVEFIEVIIGGVRYLKEIWVGEPQIQIESTILSTTEVGLRLLGKDGTDITKQNITSIQWETVSATNGASIIEPAINLPINKATFTYSGQGDLVWTIMVKVTVKNACEEVIIYKEISPTPLPCFPYTLLKTNEKEYTLFQRRGTPTNPCPDIYAKKEKVKDSDIMQAALFDNFGNEIRAYSSNVFSTENIGTGVYIFKISLQNQLITKKIIIE